MYPDSVTNLGTVVRLAPFAGSRIVAITYFSSGVSCSDLTVCPACKMKGFLGCSRLRLASCSSRSSARSRMTSNRSFWSFLSASWLAVPFLFAGRWRTSRWTNIRHLFGCPAIERDHIQVIPARERDSLFIEREMRIAFDVVCFGDLPRGARGSVVQPYVAVARIDRPLLISRGIARGRRRHFRLVIGQLPQSRTVASHDVRIRRLEQWIACLLPLKINPRAIARPTHPGGLVAIQRGPAHDVVDGELELRGRFGERRNKKRQDGERESLHCSMLACVALC